MKDFQVFLFVFFKLPAILFLTMDTVLFYTLTFNLFAVALLFAFTFKGTNYVMSWWLHVNRVKTLVNKFYNSKVFLEIKLPQEINKNPAAMEIVLNALNQGLGHKPKKILVPRPTKEVDNHGHKQMKNDGPIYKWVNKMREEFFLKYVSGSLRMSSSLEIVSQEGDITFWVMTQPKNAEIFKAYAFSQYPGIEITEKPDYSLKYDYQKKGGNLYVGRWNMDKDNILPIKTYVDYGLDRDPKEEYKIDPLTPLLEAMASAGKGESFFFQILIMPTLDEPLSDSESPQGHGIVGWKKRTSNRIDQILGIKRFTNAEVEAAEKEGKKVKVGDIKEQSRNAMQVTPSDKLELEMLQRNIEKPAFDCVLRMFYHVKEKKDFNLNKGVFSVVSAMKSFGKPGYNEFKFETVTIDTDTPFLDPTGARSEGTRSWTWMLFKLRAGLYDFEGMEAGNWDGIKTIWTRWRKGKSWDWAMVQWGEVKEYFTGVGHLPIRKENFVILNMEELVTLWHFPGKAFGNSQSRVQSVKADPPKNLPI